MKEEGATALGPALLYSIKIAARELNGQVLLCTDGMANQGLGSLEGTISQETIDFYEYLGDLALAKGVTVSIITIEGTDCRLSLLGDLANKTRGEVKIVNLNRLKDEFSATLRQESIASNVEAKLIVPKKMYIKDYDRLEYKPSSLVKKIGNANFSTEISFEFMVREEESINSSNNVPMQIQVTYTDSKGGRYMRVITKQKPITNDIKLVKNSNLINAFLFKTKLLIHI